MMMRIINEQTNERSVDEWMNEWMKESMNQWIIDWNGFTFEVDEEPALSQTRRVYDKSNIGDAGVNVDRVPPERPAVAEVCCRRCGWRRRRRPVPRLWGGHGRYLDVVLAASGTLDVQLKVEDREADRLSRLDADAPPALGVHVILVRIVGTGQVATAVELDGWCLTAGRRQRWASAVDWLNYTDTTASVHHLSLTIQSAIIIIIIIRLIQTTVHILITKEHANILKQTHTDRR